MGKNFCKIKYKGFYIIDNRNSYEQLDKDKSWYINNVK